MTRKAAKNWSADVTEHSHALDLEKGVFTWKDPKRIADSLKRSADASRKRKASPFRSALSMLTFYLNRAGKNLPAERRRTLKQAQDELRRKFAKEK
ncbi:MAG: DUF3175 domain-containing protein [Aestuariivirgaceae bacterium]